MQCTRPWQLDVPVRVSDYKFPGRGEAPAPMERLWIYLQTGASRKLDKIDWPWHRIRNTRDDPRHCNFGTQLPSREDVVAFQNYC